MSDFSRRPLRRPGVLALLSLGLALAPLGAAHAQRPSLVDLDTTVDQVVDGLCNGDASTCGATPQTPVAGQIDFGGLFAGDFSRLRFAITKPSGGPASIGEVEVSMDPTPLTAVVVDRLAAGFTFGSVVATVPNPSGPGSVPILTFSDAVLVSAEVSSDGSRAALTFSVGAVAASWLGSQSSYDQGTQAAAGCTVPPGERHVALAGNDGSLLGPADIEADFALGFSTSGGPLTTAFSYGRVPVASSACLVRTVATAVNLQAEFHRLSPLSDTFATALEEETVEITSAVATSHELLIEGTTIRESIALDVSAGKLTSREFDPGTGAEVGAIPVNF